MPLTSRKYSMHVDSDTFLQDESGVNVVETFLAAIVSITKKHLPNQITCDATAGPSNMNELREVRDEEGVGESYNGGYGALDLEQGFKTPLLGIQIDVDGTTIFGEESGRLPPRTPVDFSPTTVKTPLG